MLAVDVENGSAISRSSAAFETAGGVTALFGPSGSGKTSLVNMIAGLMRRTAGASSSTRRCCSTPRARIDVPPHRRRIGYVFQDGRLFPHLTVASNLDYGRRMSRLARRSARAGAHRRRCSTSATCSTAGPDAVGRRAPARRDRPRAADAPRLLLLDEPLASLDAARKREILPYLERLRDEAHVPMVYVSHHARNCGASRPRWCCSTPAAWPPPAALEVLDAATAEPGVIDWRRAPPWRSGLLGQFGAGCEARSRRLQHVTGSMLVERQHRPQLRRRRPGGWCRTVHGDDLLVTLGRRERAGERRPSCLSMVIVNATLATAARPPAGHDDAGCRAPGRSIHFARPASGGGPRWGCGGRRGQREYSSLSTTPSSRDLSPAARHPPPPAHQNSPSPNTPPHPPIPFPPLPLLPFPLFCFFPGLLPFPPPFHLFTIPPSSVPARAHRLPHRRDRGDALSPRRGAPHRRRVGLCGAAAAGAPGEAAGLRLHLRRLRRRSSRSSPTSCSPSPTCRPTSSPS